MKILAIRIKNLASLHGVSEIDFTTEPLLSAGIFAITGHTGAGKSTILDALCLAFYEKTPRYISAETQTDIADTQNSTIKQNDVRSILRKDTADGFAEVDFEALNGNKYRSRWSVRRARNNSLGNLQSSEMSLIDLQTMQPLPGNKTEILKEITQLIGLTYEQFIRSVLLAQGDFTAFLKAAKKEKASLLEKLTGSDIYSKISIQIFENQRSQKEILTKLEDKITSINIFSEEELAEKQAEKENLKCLHKKQDIELNLLTKEKNWHLTCSQLTEKKENAKINAEATTAQIVNAKPRYEKLQEIDRVQPARSLLKDLQNEQKKWEELTELSKAQNEKCLQLQILQEKERLKKDEWEQIWHKKQLALTHAKPQLDRAKILDSKLETTGNQKKEAELNVEKEKSGKLQHENHLSEKIKLIEQLTTEINAIENWFAKNESRKQIAEEEILLKNKLSEATATLDEMHGIDLAAKKIELAINEERQNLNKLSEKSEEIESAISTKQSETNNLHSELKEIDITRLEALEEQQNLALKNLEESEKITTQLYDAQVLLHKIEDKIETYTSEQTNKVEWLHELKREFEKIKIEKEILQKLFNQSQIESTKNAKTLREQLQTDQPCPICGSTTHPYKQENRDYDSTLRIAKAQLEQCENRHLELLSLLSKTEQEINNFTDNIESLSDERLEKQNSARSLQTQWEKCVFYETAKNREPKLLIQFFQEQMAEQKARLDNTQTLLKKYKSVKEKWEQTRDSLAQLTEEQMRISNKILDLKHRIQLKELDLKNSMQKKEDLQSKLNRMHASIGTYFKSDNWYANWEENPALFRGKIEQFALVWRTKKESLAANKTQLGIETALLANLQLKSEELDQTVTEKEETLHHFEQLWNELHKERVAIFGGKPAEEAEQELHEAAEQAKEQLNNCVENLQHCTDELLQWNTRKEETLKQVAAAQQETNHRQEAFSTWLSSRNVAQNNELSESTVVELLSLDDQWIADERALLRQLEDAHGQAKSLLAERERELEEHLTRKISEKQADEIEQQILEIQNTRENCLKKSAEIGLELEINERNNQQTKQLRLQIDQQRAIFNDWQILNDLIGSSDGKKFREIAQEFTLDVLINYSNQHLRTLSRRYILERTPNSLAMQVRDTDMGDEVRSVYSLSGGETFLVSLALALGLASLSSNRIQVETLFIDEGFGSLDADTLHIAMDALESLHNQGRKVGVISHVQEMTERIPAQIHVCKQSFGRSKILIKGR